MEYLEHFTGRTNVFAAMEEVKRLLAVAMERFAGAADKNRVCVVVSSCFKNEFRFLIPVFVFLGFDISSRFPGAK